MDRRRPRRFTLTDARLPFADGDVRSTEAYPKTWSWTQRHNMAIGLHPMGMPLANNNETCGTCRHATKHDRWWKCNKAFHTFGPGTDIRVGWPACNLWETQ